MQRFARVWTRGQRSAAAGLQPQRSALKRGIVVACRAAVCRHAPSLETRGFQTSTVLLKRYKNSTRPMVPVKSDDSDSDNDSDSDLEFADSDDEEPFDDDDDEQEEEEEEGVDDVDEEAAAEGHAMAAQYIGVKYSPTKVKKYSAELEIDSIVISGGDFWTALDAAKGYDELVDLYCDLDTPRNFPAGSEAAEAAAGALAVGEQAAAEWEVPDAGSRNADIIPPIPGTYLTVDEVLAALEREKAIDVYTVNLAGKSSLADYMIFTTGRSMAHMRRMADMMIQSMKARELKDDFEYAVEGRDCDDWMIADCSNIVVHFMREDTRRILNLEDHWENMVNDKHKVYGDMTEDEYMDRFGTSELMEYLEEDDFVSAEDADKVVDSDGVEWK